MLVGNETHDDAGVFRLADDMALVQTVDFFTPVVDDPRLFGRIAAVNSLSDIYAMGGTPLTALNLLATPADGLSPEVVSEMLAGGQETMDQARTSIIGGHSIDDPEPKMGYAVTGLVHPSHIWRNDRAQAGELVFLTKPIGTGLIIKAIKDGTADSVSAEAAQTMMATLNGPAQEAIRAAVGDPGACTDVTGFGLLGHLWELAAGSGVRAELYRDRVPVLPGARELAEQKAFPRGSLRNWEFVQEHVDLDGPPGFVEWLLADAVTSGGLLFTAPKESRESLEAAFRERGLDLWEIGLIALGEPGVELRSFSMG